MPAWAWLPDLGPIRVRAWACNCRACQIHGPIGLDRRLCPRPGDRQGSRCSAVHASLARRRCGASLRWTWQTRSAAPCTSCSRIRPSTPHTASRGRACPAQACGPRPLSLPCHPRQGRGPRRARPRAACDSARAGPRSADPRHRRAGRDHRLCPPPHGIGRAGGGRGGAVERCGPCGRAHSR